MNPKKSLMIKDHIPARISEIHLTYPNRISAAERLQITGSADDYRLLSQHWSDQMGLLEEFVILLLDRVNRVMGKYVFSRAGVVGTVIDAILIFACALKCRAFFAHPCV